MVKKLGLSVEARYIDSLLAKMDGNRSGYVEFDDFKKFLFNNPYPY
jgi:Ca2+-binding EF-hand superfamily protein